MVRLMLVLAPVMCILSGIGISSVLSAFMPNIHENNSSGSLISGLVGSSDNNANANTKASTNVKKAASTAQSYPMKYEVNKQKQLMKIRNQ